MANDLEKVFEELVQIRDNRAREKRVIVELFSKSPDERSVFASHEGYEPLGKEEFDILQKAFRNKRDMELAIVFDWILRNDTFELAQTARALCSHPYPRRCPYFSKAESLKIARLLSELTKALNTDNSPTSLIKVGRLAKEATDYLQSIKYTGGAGDGK